MKTAATWRTTRHRPLRDESFAAQAGPQAGGDPLRVGAARALRLMAFLPRSMMSRDMYVTAARMVRRQCATYALATTNEVVALQPSWAGS
jgi:hypothetical protein